MAICALSLPAAPVRAGSVLTPGLAAGGVPLGTTVWKVLALLGQPTSELQDPTNPLVYLQRWEPLCLGARYTPEGDLLALDVWADVGEQCDGATAAYTVEGAGGRRVTFGSTRQVVKAAFGYAPDRVLRADTFTLLVYDGAGVAFYLRETGTRAGGVDAITIFPRGASRIVWAPASWGGR